MTKPAGNKNCLPADTGRQKNLHNKRIPVFLTLCLSQRLEYQADCWLGHKPLQRRERSGFTPLIVRLFAPDNHYYFFVLFKSYTLLLRMSTYFSGKYTVYFQFTGHALGKNSLADSACALPADCVKRFWCRLVSSCMVNQGYHIC